MRDNDPTAPTDTGLSTDDIVRSRERDTGPETDRDEAARDTGRAPVYPGEAVGTDSSAEAGGEHGLGDETGSSAEPGDESGSSAEPGEGTPAAAEPGGMTASSAEAGGMTTSSAEAGDEDFRLMDPEDAERFRSRWHELQSLFVDDPRRAVKEADELVAAVMQKLATTFADHRRALEGQWREGEDVDTERLRMALRQYRSFFQRLLSSGQSDGDPGDPR